MRASPLELKLRKKAERASKKNALLERIEGRTDFFQGGSPLTRLRPIPATAVWPISGFHPQELPLKNDIGVSY